MKYTLLAIIGLFILSGCSIEKRHYTSGYHIDWHHNKNFKFNSECEVIEKQNDKIEKLNVSVQEVKSIQDEASTSAAVRDSPTFNMPAKATNDQPKSISQIEVEVPSQLNMHEDDPKTLQNPYAKKSAFFGVMAWVLPIFDVVFITSFGTITLGLALILLLTILICAILAISYGNTALKQIDLNPGKYNNRGQARFGKGLGAALLIVIGIIFIYGLTLIGF